MADVSTPLTGGSRMLPEKNSESESLKSLPPDVSLFVQWTVQPLIDNYDEDEFDYLIHVHSGFTERSRWGQEVTAGSRCRRAPSRECSSE